MPGKGTLYLIPSTIADETQHKVIPPQVKSELTTIHHFLVENVRTARRYLSSLRVYESIELLSFETLDKDTSAADLPGLFTPIDQGKNMGIISESGCPGVADPGAIAVKYAHQHGIKVVPLVGPSSILLALMGSGLNGQRFAFHGYLPIDSKEAAKAIKDAEKESRVKNQTQIFIETPYRNNTLMKNLLKTLGAETWLCIAVDLTGSSEQINTLQIQAWKKKSTELPRLPALFLFLAYT